MPCTTDTIRENSLPATTAPRRRWMSRLAVAGLLVLAIVGSWVIGGRLSRRPGRRPAR